ncbi:DUF6482 family protein [Vibrio fluminensis]|uniref:DUF6482 family protein n=1 Tax=Vibrio fluminensis TaxID=2783614 RepID=UPI0018879721|nr:DUF6482 family protein [Vibrio fluminensis]
MAMSLHTLEQFFYLDKLVVHSLDLSLYQVSVEVDGEEHFIIDDKGKMLRAFSIVELQKQCANLNAKKWVLRQQSAYDEMVGAPIRQQDNTLEVPLGNNKLY